MSGVPRLHVVTDDSVLSRQGWSASAAAVLEAGQDELALHVRGPRTSGARMFELCGLLQPDARSAGAWLVVNDRVDVALALGLGAVHLGERSLPITDARSVLPEGVRVGVSRHSPSSAGRAAAEGADYAFVGTIFPTPSHEGVPTLGVDGLSEAVSCAGALPLLGIGGIGVGEVPRVLGSGAFGIAVVRGVWDHPEPAEAARAYLEAIEEAIDE